MKKILKVLAVPFAALLLSSCANELDAEFVSDGKINPDRIVYNFKSKSDRKIFDEQMHPEGSTAPKGIVYRNTICVISWMRPDDTRVYAIWNADGGKLRVPLKTSGNIFGFYEMGGSQTRLELFGNKIQADLTDKLLYVLGSPDLTIEILPEKKK